METVTSLAVNSAGTMLAAHSVKFDNYDYDFISYIFVVRAEDGHYVTDVHEITHGKRDKGEFIVEASGMYFDPYGIVYMGFNFVGSKGANADDGSFNEYASKLAVGAFNANSKAMEFYWH